MRGGKDTGFPNFRAAQIHPWINSRQFAFDCERMDDAAAYYRE
ncbi:hypothetical protein [Microbulbifer sp. JTAC008]